MHYSLLSLLYHAGLPTMFLIVAIENMGVPLPTEVAYVAAQTLISQGKLSYFWAVVILSVGHVAGSLISYWLGTRIAARLEAHHTLKGRKKKIIDWYRKYGTWATFVARFVGHVRPWVSYVAGMAEIPFPSFLILTTIGAIIFNMISLEFTRTIIHLWNEFPIAHILIPLFFVVTMLGVIFYFVEEKDE